jgi:hypothetical protein
MNSAGLFFQVQKGLVLLRIIITFNKKLALLYLANVNRKAPTIPKIEPKKF